MLHRSKINHPRLSQPTFIHWEALNAYRGLALCAMVTIHTLVWCSSTEKDGFLQQAPVDQLFIVYAAFSIFGWFALSFAMSTGISFQFWYENTKSKKVKLRQLFFRCGLLAGVGFFLNPKSWYIFQFLSLSTLLAYLIWNLLGHTTLYILGAASSFLGILLAESIQNWPSHYLKSIIVGDSTGQFFWPLLPWFSLFVAGIAISHLYQYSDRIKTRLFNGILILIGFAFFDLALITHQIIPQFDQRDLWGPAIFQPRPIAFLGWSGMMISSLGIFGILMNTRFRRVLGIFAVLAPNTLILYMIHYKLLVKLVFRFHNRSSLKAIGLIGIQIIILFGISLLINHFIWKLKVKRKLTHDHSRQK